MSFTTVERAIADRLVERLGTLVKKVYVAAELAQIEEESQATPGVMVAYDGYQPANPVPGSQGKIQLVQHNWLIVVHARSATGARTSQGAKDECGPIIKAVLAALCGWRPLPIEEGESPLLLSAAPGAAYTDAGFAYLPIAFTNSRTVRGTD